MEYKTETSKPVQYNLLISNVCKTEVVTFSFVQVCFFVFWIQVHPSEKSIYFLFGTKLQIQSPPNLVLLQKIFLLAAINLKFQMCSDSVPNAATFSFDRRIHIKPSNRPSA